MASLSSASLRPFNVIMCLPSVTLWVTYRLTNICTVAVQLMNRMTTKCSFTWNVFIRNERLFYHLIYGITLNCIICLPFVTFVDTRLYIVSTTVDSLLTDTSLSGFLCKKGLVELVPAFLHSLYLTIRRTNLVPRALFAGFEGGAPPSNPAKRALGTRLKTDITVRRTLGAGPLSVHAYRGGCILAIVMRKNARNKFILYLPCAIFAPKGILHR